MKNKQQAYSLWIVRLAALVVVTALVLGLAPAAQAQEQPGPVQPAEPADAAADAAAADAATTLYMPLVYNDVGNTATRIGIDVLGSITDYPVVRQLNAGWYTNWYVVAKPARPGGAEFLQTIRVHQKLSCGDWFNANRTACPYAEPKDYVYRPTQAELVAAIKANPGSTWAIGNEIDRPDWQECTAYEADGVTCQPGKTQYTGQDEMLPETYARAYHDLYNLVKSTDPTAKVAIAGVIQPTPLRLKYLTAIWDSYKSQYGADMPVDVWNIHAFILREKKGEYGAEIPPGMTETSGSYLETDATHIDRTIFDRQIRAFRKWMNDRGQESKPLIVSEYGILYNHCVVFDSKGKCTVNLDDPTLVTDFMVWTFDYFLNTKDCTLTQTDECRLVQRWAWFALNTTSQDSNGNLVSALNKYGSLINTTTGQLMIGGQRFINFVTSNYDALRTPVP